MRNQFRIIGRSAIDHNDFCAHAKFANYFTNQRQQQAQVLGFIEGRDHNAEVRSRPEFCQRYHNLVNGVSTGAVATG